MSQTAACRSLDGACSKGAGSGMGHPQAWFLRLSPAHTCLCQRLACCSSSFFKKGPAGIPVPAYDLLTLSQGFSAGADGDPSGHWTTSWRHFGYHSSEEPALAGQRCYSVLYNAQVSLPQALALPPVSIG
jgi:hypothetical protein